MRRLLVVLAVVLALLPAPPGDAQTSGGLQAPIVAMAATPDGGGYWLFGRDGGVFGFGNAAFLGSMGGRPLNQPMVGGAATPTGRGYWLAAADGGIFTFGDARFLGSTGAIRLNSPIVAMAAAPDGRGYWLFARDGGVFAFGSARFFGAMGGRRLNQPIVGGAATSDGRGYWLVAADGGIFTFGAARFLGSAGSLRLARPIVAMASRPQDDGYWLFGADGGVFTYGRAPFVGAGVGSPGAVGAAPAPDGGGYWIALADGGVRAFGTARPHGSVPAAPPPSAGVALRQIATVNAPTAMAVRRGDPALYVTERAGVVRAIRSGAVDPTPVLDISTAVSTGAEQGLLGLTFNLDGSRLYLNHTDTAGDSRILEYRMTGAGRADPATRRELLRVDQPDTNHNGGDLRVGSDGLLYIALGDGGGANDPAGNAQNLESLLGKILRIDPAGSPYAIPPSNPFVGRPGRDEIWAYGLRNPWRLFLDPVTGDQWIADVGQGQREEVNRVPAGAAGVNYGWDRMEGTVNVDGQPPAGHTPPIHEYEHRDGRCSITGGVVVRGGSVPALRDRYLFGDFCTGEVNALEVTASGARVTRLEPTVRRLVSFGVDGAGEIYALSLSGGIFRFVAG